MFLGEISVAAIKQQLAKARERRQAPGRPHILSLDIEGWIESAVRERYEAHTALIYMELLDLTVSPFDRDVGRHAETPRPIHTLGQIHPWCPDGIRMSRCRPSGSQATPLRIEVLAAHQILSRTRSPGSCGLGLPPARHTITWKPSSTLA
jgi:hypothetical protein